MIAFAALAFLSAPVPASTAEPMPTLICREMFPAASRSQAFKICRTKEEWVRWKACNGSVTRFCTSKTDAAMAGATMGPQTPFALSEDARIICRKVRVTGTRLQQVQACLPKREWDRMWEQGRESAAAFQDHQSKIRFDQDQ